MELREGSVGGEVLGSNPRIRLGLVLLELFTADVKQGKDKKIITEASYDSIIV